MKISVEFDSLEELKTFVGTISVGPLSEKALAVWAQAREAEIAEREEKPAPKKAPVKAAAKPEPAPEPEEEEAEEEKPAKEEKKAKKEGPTETQIKLLASQKVKENKTAQIKDFFAKWGGKKVSEVLEKHPDEWAQIYAELEEL